MPDSTKTATGNQLIKKMLTISSDTGEQSSSFKKLDLHKDILIPFNSVMWETSLC